MNAARLLAHMRRHVPEFTADDLFLDLPHAIFGEFARFLIERIRGCGVADPVVRRSFLLVNDLFSEGDPEAINIIETTLFEQIADDSIVLGVAKPLLEAAGRKSLEEVATWAGSNDVTPR